MISQPHSCVPLYGRRITFEVLSGFIVITRYLLLVNFCDFEVTYPRSNNVDSAKNYINTGH